jgi:hypothetical protein
MQQESLQIAQVPRPGQAEQDGSLIVPHLDRALWDQLPSVLMPWLGQGSGGGELLVSRPLQCRHLSLQLHLLLTQVVMGYAVSSKRW